MKKIEIINLLKSAVELAGDGGPNPFTDREYREMYKFLSDLEKL